MRCLLDGRSHVLPADEQGHHSHGGDHRIGLLQLVQAVAVLFQHLLRPADLAFDAAKPLQDGLALLRCPTQKQAAAGELVVHGMLIRPRRVSLGDEAFKPGLPSQARRSFLMFYHDKRLQYPVKVGTPDPVFARMLQQAIGGVEGEIRVCMGVGARTRA